MKTEISNESKEFIDTPDLAVDYVLTKEFFSGLKKLLIIGIISSILCQITSSIYDSSIDNAIKCKEVSHLKHSPRNDEAKFKELEELLKI